MGFTVTGRRLTTPVFTTGNWLPPSAQRVWSLGLPYATPAAPPTHLHKQETLASPWGVLQVYTRFIPAEMLRTSSTYLPGQLVFSAQLGLPYWHHNFGLRASKAPLTSDS